MSMSVTCTAGSSTCQARIAGFSRTVGAISEKVQALPLPVTPTSRYEALLKALPAAASSCVTYWASPKKCTLALEGSRSETLIWQRRATLPEYDGLAGG